MIKYIGKVGLLVIVREKVSFRVEVSEEFLEIIVCFTEEYGKEI